MVAFAPLAIAGAGFVGDILGGIGANKAAKKEAKMREALYQEQLWTQNDEFGKRLGVQRHADKTAVANEAASFDDLGAWELGQTHSLLGLGAEGFDESMRLGREAFARELGLEGETFDRLQTVAGQTFDKQMEALGGLMTAQRAARLEMQATSEAERARQMAFQGEADELAAALPGAIGFDAQQDTLAEQWAKRKAGAEAAATGAVAPVSKRGMSDELAALFDAESARGRGQALDQAAAQSKLSAASDAFTASERQLGDFGDEISQLTRKAQMSRALLPGELGVGRLKLDDADADFDFATGLAEALGGMRYDTEKGYGENRLGTAQRYGDNMLGANENRYSALLDARSGYADNMGRAKGDYWSRKSAADVAWAQNLIDTSLDYENKMSQNSQYRMGSVSKTSPLSTFGSLLKTGANAYSSYRNL